MTTNIYLRKGKKGVTVYIRYRHKNYEKLFSTMIKIDPEKWDKKSNCVNLLKGEKIAELSEDLIKNLKSQTASANTQIKTVESQIVDIAQRLIHNSKEPTPAAISKQLKQLEKKDKDKDSFGVLELLQWYIDANKSVLNNSTIKQHSSSFETFKSFYNSQKIRPEKLIEINYDYFSRYVSWLSADQKLSHNTIWNKIKWLKSALNDYKRRGYEVFDTAKFSYRRENPSKIIYLFESEIEKLESHDFGDASYLKRATDVFLFVCNTGFRYSDVKRIRKTHITNDIIQLRAYKNQKDTIVPLNASAKEILVRYHYKLPIISEQVFNRFLKEAFKRAELTRNIEKTIIKDGKKQIEVFELHKLASSHMAIRTFISRCLHRGVSVVDVARMTGKSSKVLLAHYSGHLDDQRLVEVMNNAFKPK